MSSHRAIAITSLGVLGQVDIPTPAPNSNEVVIEVRYVGLTPADVYQLDRGQLIQQYPAVIGLSGAGYVKAVGDGVTDLKAGDKVASANYPVLKNMAGQEFAVVPRSIVAKLPDDYNLAEAATLGDNYSTAALTLFGANYLSLPLPSSFPASSPPQDANQPILVNGGAATSGQYTIQLLHLAGYTQVYATASPKNHAYLKELGATKVFDYRSPNLAKEILEATGGAKVAIVVDTIASIPGIKAYSSVLDQESRLAMLFPIKKGTSILNDEDDLSKSKDLLPLVKELVGGAPVVLVMALIGLFEDPVAPTLLPKLLPRLLESGALRPNRIRLFGESDGPILERVKRGLELLRENKISGEKVVIELVWN
ncbi:GroES-like protein [Irpex lacteus]|nr:GroES-like protein [Irpex lacteus]